MQGQRMSQLQFSRYSPLSCHATAIPPSEIPPEKLTVTPADPLAEETVSVVGSAWAGNTRITGRVAWR